jgi:colanic acid/amylovoran biosynthesis glycosyltransferase
VSHRLAILVRDVGALTETFIGRHACHLLPGETVIIGRQQRTLDKPGWVPTGPVEDPGERRGGLRGRLNRLLRRRLQPGLTGEMLNVESILRTHGVEVVLAEYLDTSLRFVRAADRAGVPYFAHAHGYDVTANLRMEKWRRAYLEYNNTAGVITMSNISGQRLLEIGLHPDKVHVIPYGVDVPDRPCVRSPGKQVSCLAVGRMVPKKGPMLTLRAFRIASDRCEQLHLDYVGDGELMPAVRQYVRDAGLSGRVTLHGALPVADVQSRMRSADVFLQHSITDTVTGDAEGLPVAILEAMASALPVIATRHEGIPEAVLDGESGLLSEEGDVEAMAENLVSLAEDAERRSRMGEAGWRRARDRFTWERERRDLLHLLGLEHVSC